jgi:beta-N-acetylhexosaminidase
VPQAAGIGTSLVGVGVDLDLAPVLDLDDGDARGLIGDRSFSGDAATASAYGLAFAAGLQDAGVTPTVKHFPGHGRAEGDPHTGDSVVDATLAELRDSDLVPFQDAVDAGAPVVMTAHAQYPELLGSDLPASVNPATYELLRDMGFEGVAITDSVGMGAVNLRFDFPEAAVLAVAAGADAVLATDGTQAGRMRDGLVEAVRSGRLPEERLSEAAARVTALAGGDPQEMSCLDATVPRLSVPWATSPSPTSPSSTVPPPTSPSTDVPTAAVPSLRRPSGDASAATLEP